jgi:hypothetical protein
MNYNLEQIEQKARELSPKPLSVKEVKTEVAGIKLLGLLETHLVTQGFVFKDIEGDKNNTACVKSRLGKLIVTGGHGVVICLRLFRRVDGTSSFFVQVQ